MSSLESILWDLGFRERVECYGNTQPTPPTKSGHVRSIAEKMLNSYHAQGFGSEKMTFVPARTVPRSEAYKRNLPLAIYSAP